MNEAESLAIQVDEILTRYIAIHDDIFKFSFRKVIPSQGIFKVIDFCSHKNKLTILQTELAETQRCIVQAKTSPGLTSPESPFLTELNDFSIALIDTVNRLRSISEALCRKSKEEYDYSMRQYNDDIAAYDVSVERYMAIGNRLNLSLCQIRAANKEKGDVRFRCFLGLAENLLALTATVVTVYILWRTQWVITIALALPIYFMVLDISHSFFKSKSGLWCFWDLVRHLLILTGTAVIVYLLWKVHWVVAVVLAFPVYLVSLNFFGFLTLCLYDFTPESKAARKYFEKLEESFEGKSVREKED